jgi:hypothetical protein
MYTLYLDQIHPLLGRVIVGWGGAMKRVKKRVNMAEVLSIHV